MFAVFIFVAVGILFSHSVAAFHILSNRKLWRNFFACFEFRFVVDCRHYRRQHRWAHRRHLRIVCICFDWSFHLNDTCNVYRRKKQRNEMKRMEVWLPFLSTQRFAITLPIVAALSSEKRWTKTIYSWIDSIVFRRLWFSFCHHFFCLSLIVISFECCLKINKNIFALCTRARRTSDACKIHVRRQNETKTSDDTNAFWRLPIATMVLIKCWTNRRCAWAQTKRRRRWQERQPQCQQQMRPD